MNRKSYCSVSELHYDDNKEDFKELMEQMNEKEDNSAQQSSLQYVLVSFQNEVVQLSLSTLTNFKEFDWWVRGRFGLHSEKLIYSNDKHEEILPNFSTLSSQKSFQVVITIDQKSLPSSLPPTSTSPPPPPSKTTTQQTKRLMWNKDLQLFSFSVLFPIVSLLYLLVFLSPSCPFPNPMKYFSVVSPIFSWIGVEKEVQLSLYREMVCTFISWPVPYFFIRRSLNSDFGLELSFLKFGSDAFWGAFAASALVLLRHFVKGNLTGMS